MVIVDVGVTDAWAVGVWVAPRTTMREVKLGPNEVPVSVISRQLLV